MRKPKWKEINSINHKQRFERSNPQTYVWTEAGWDNDAYKRNYDAIFGKKGKRSEEESGSEEAQGRDASDDGGQANRDAEGA